MKLSRQVRNYIEHELRHYHQTKRELEQERDTIINETGYADESGIRGSGIGDPAAKKAIKLITNTRLKKMEETVRAIDAVVADLDEEKHKLVELRYWKRPQILNDTGIAHEIGIDRSTLWRWSAGIVTAIAKEMGLA